MRYSVEHQRNIAFDLLWLNRKEINLDDVINADAVIIHGFDFIGKELYHILKEDMNVLCFIDRAHNNEVYENVKVYSVENPKLYEISKPYKNIKVIVTIISDKENIFEAINSKFFNAQPISIYEILANAKLQEQSYKNSFNIQTLQLIDSVLKNNVVSIPNIILAGTAYTMLLNILYLDNWKESLFVIERFVSNKIAEKMKDMGLYCMYEKNAVDYYSLTYVLSEYAQKSRVSVWGHDHMQLSGAFLNNKVHIMEDGIGNYISSTPLRFPVFLDNGRRYLPFGYDENIEHVVLTGMFEIPSELEGKTEIVNPKELWNKKTEEEKRLISDIFCFPYEEIKGNTSEEKKIIFLTEPIISIGEVVISEEEQIKIYRKILSNYSKKQIAIKPHPADYINYREIFPEYLILDKDFPMQMIEWCDIEVDRYIVMKGSSCERILKEKYTVDVYDGINLI